MREAGPEDVSRRRPPRTTVIDERAQPADDLVERDFNVDAPDTLWLADITYIPTSTTYMYLSVVVNAFSQRAVGWSMASHLEAKLVVNALDMASERRNPEGCIHHSDQRSQYTSIMFGQRCQDEGVRRSMGSTGDCYDNAMCESFLASLECELIERKTFRNPPEASRQLFRYIEGWYNPDRRHSALDYLFPIDYERKWSSDVVTILAEDCP
jgi:putative transposase